MYFGTTLQIKAVITMEGLGIQSMEIKSMESQHYLYLNCGLYIEEIIVLCLNQKLSNYKFLHHIEKHHQHIKTH